MSAERIPPQGLADAQRRIRRLADDLNETMTSVRRLHGIGQDQIALGLIREQRARLDGFVHAIAGDIAVADTFSKRRRLTAGVAAAVFALASMLTVAALRSHSQDLGAQLHRAERIQDPAARLSALRTVYTKAVAHPSALTVSFRHEVARAAHDTGNNLGGPGPRDDNPELSQQAKLLESAAMTGQPVPSQPPQASAGQTLERVKGRARPTR